MATKYGFRYIPLQKLKVIGECALIEQNVNVGLWIFNLEASWCCEGSDAGAYVVMENQNLLMLCLERQTRESRILEKCDHDVENGHRDLTYKQT